MDIGIKLMSIIAWNPPKKIIIIIIIGLDLPVLNGDVDGGGPASQRWSRESHIAVEKIRKEKKREGKRVM